MLFEEELQSRLFRPGCAVLVPGELDLLAEVVNEYMGALRGNRSGDGGADAEGIVSPGDQNDLVLQSGIDHGVLRLREVGRRSRMCERRPYVPENARRSSSIARKRSAWTDLTVSRSVLASGGS